MAAILSYVGSGAEGKVRAMSERLSHGGPAASMEVVTNNIVISSIGLPGEHSLFTSARWATSATGRVYNLEHLISSIKAIATIQSPGNDVAEVLTLVYEHLGLSGLATVDGHFAAIIHDRADNRTILLNDFFGQVPLYWSPIGVGKIAFASEIKAFLAIDEFEPIPDREVIQLVQGTKRLAVGRTCLKNVEAVKPGVTVVSNGKEESYQNFEQLEGSASITSEEAAKDAVVGALQNCLRNRLKPGDRIGLALSGGIDSIALAFMLRDLFPDRDIHTFTAGRDENDQEIVTAAKVAAQARTIHHPIYTPPQLLETELEKLIWLLEAPAFRSETLQLMRVGEEARKHVDVMITGQGADNLFAGMPKHKLLALIKRFPILREPLSEIYNLTQVGIRPTSLPGRILAYILYRGKVPAVPTVIGANGVLAPKQLPKPGPTFINNALASALQPSAIQARAKFERTLGNAAVHYFSPFNDLTLARTACSIDEDLKIRKGVQKYVLRRAISSFVPDEFVAIPKYPQRMQYDLEFAEVLDRVADSMLAHASIVERGYFDPDSIRNLRRVNKSAPYHPEAAMRLWTAILTEHWARVFLDHRAANPSALPQRAGEVAATRQTS